MYDELCDTEAHTRTVVAAIDGEETREKEEGGEIEERTWERWAELEIAEDLLGLPDCDVRAEALATWIVQAENNGRVQTGVEVPQRSLVEGKESQASSRVGSKVIVLVDSSEEVDGDVPMLIVTAPNDD